MQYLKHVMIPTIYIASLLHPCNEEINSLLYIHCTICLFVIKILDYSLIKDKSWENNSLENLSTISLTTDKCPCRVILSWVSVPIRDHFSWAPFTLILSTAHKTAENGHQNSFPYITGERKGNFMELNVFFSSPCH